MQTALPSAVTVTSPVPIMPHSTGKERHTSTCVCCVKRWFALLNVGKTKEIGFVSVMIARFMVRKAQTGVKCRH